MMTSKQSIVAALGEQALALPHLVNAALAANDRIKYRLTLLQLARRHADAPDAPLASLRAERLQARIDEGALDELPAACLRTAEGCYRLPGAAQQFAAIELDLKAMLAPLPAAGAAVPAAERAALESRGSLLLPPLRAARDEFSAAELDAISHGERARGDSVHLLVMDLHKVLNRLQHSIATEVLDGASVYALTPDDRALVRAFMRGVNRSSRLRFDHPGLGTTATRSGGRLVLQNDIGTTDAHVLVIHVEPGAVTVTYTDVHLQRLLFLQELLHPHPVEWQDTRLVQDRQMEDGLYHVAIGRYACADPGRLAGFLEFLGSRIVFLIDWNRARKQLRQLVGKQESLRLLRWAAEQELGHMAFLRLGGAQAVFEALDFALQGHSRFGQTLEDLLGAERAARFLEFVLRTAATELLAGRPQNLVLDELRGELMRHLRGSGEGLLDLACEHAALIVEIAAAVRDALAGLARPDGQSLAERLATRCKGWESDADRVVNQVREAAHGAVESNFLCELVERADDVADGLEETAFLATLLRPVNIGPALQVQLAALAGQLCIGAQELVKALETLRTLAPGAPREDLRDFLQAIHRIGRVEHETDELKRRVAVELVREQRDARQLHLVAESAAGLEQAADQLQHAAWLLRDGTLTQLARH